MGCSQTRRGWKQVTPAWFGDRRFPCTVRGQASVVDWIALRMDNAQSCKGRSDDLELDVRSNSSNSTDHSLRQPFVLAG